MLFQEVKDLVISPWCLLLTWKHSNQGQHSGVSELKGELCWSSIFTFSLLHQHPMSESLDYATSSTKRVGRQHMTPRHLRSPTLWTGGTLPVKRACGLPIFSTTLIAMLLTFPFFWEFILVPSRTACADVILLSVHKFFLSLYFPHPLSVPSLSWPSALHYTQLPAINISFLVALCWN